MTMRVAAGLRIVRAVAERPDPTAPVSVGELARRLGLPLSGASRLCAELHRLGFLERGDAYGSYRIGDAAIALSGLAARPVAQTVRAALTIAGQTTGETVCLAARAEGGMRIVAAVVSPWTLFSAAEVGELVHDPESAIVRAAQGTGGDEDDPRHFRSTIGRSVELATPVFDPAGECLAVLAVRLPVNRARRGVPAARRALAAARRALERRVEDVLGSVGDPAPRAAAGGDAQGAPSALQAAMRMLRHLAEGPDGLAGIARAAGVRRDRAQRIVDSCRAVGVVMDDIDRGGYRLAWGIHGWHRAAAAPIMATRGAPLVAAAADATGACAFITVLKGMRSVTLVEELEIQGEGLRMTPWLGRPCPLMSADGGPTLVMDFGVDEVAPLLPRREPQAERDEFLARMRQVTQDGVIAKESFEEAGLLSVSAPIRDSSGSVAAAACIVAATDQARSRVRALRQAALELAAGVTALLGGPDADGTPAAAT
ncbi:MarR family transcriptional regulator [Microbacterium album]|uniref:IclR family transcriptional regulator n=1 Tax=Microbacterium album TaxID=2053191 RepID=A0A917IGI8_9MICO|nr:helix-turn-helix domain-containing protein [Microbacterium album]GGH46904.1 hypothetical protein GCM10010921_23280 [Microbacterium album]